MWSCHEPFLAVIPAGFSFGSGFEGPLPPLGRAEREDGCPLPIPTVRAGTGRAGPPRLATVDGSPRRELGLTGSPPTGRTLPVGRGLIGTVSERRAGRMGSVRVRTGFGAVFGFSVVVDGVAGGGFVGVGGGGGWGVVEPSFASSEYNSYIYFCLSTWPKW